MVNLGAISLGVALEVEHRPDLYGAGKAARLCSFPLEKHWISIVSGQCLAHVRYQWLPKTYPGIVNRAPHLYVASFLGMTQGSLSMIRKELSEQKEQSSK